MASYAAEIPNEIEAIVGGYHGDVFRVLGPHQLQDAEDGAPRWVVRAFLPHAASAEVIVGTAAIPMEKKHAHGFFVAHFDAEVRDYRLRVQLWNGGTEITDYPYRFPPLLTDFDLYLFAEATHY